MLIRMFNSSPDINNIHEISGIRECKRTINLFVDKEQYRLGVCKSGRAVIINESLIAGDKTMHLCKIKNGNIIKVSVYYFDVVFDDVNNLQTAIFTLTESFGAERQISYDNVFQPATVFDFAEYSSLLTGIDDYTRNFLAGTDDTFIPPPQYYNELHMNNVEGDFASILGYDTVLYYSGNDLIDDFTTTNYYNILFWDSMNPVIKEQLIKDQMHNVDSVGDISSELFYTFSNASLDKGMFIYDSQLGVNIKDVVFPYAKYQHKNLLIGDLNRAKIAFTSACKDIEKKYGSVRVHMNQGLIGDTYSINCKDYEKENQPFKPINSNKNTISIDKSYPTESAVNEFIYTIAQQEE